MTDTGRVSNIALSDVSPRPVRPAEAPYQLFLAASLALAVAGGFMLAVLLPVARALEWDWGTRWQELVQVHGQLQLFGFVGLFIIGMALRMMPRFSGRPLAYAGSTGAIVVLIGVGVVARAMAPLIEHEAFHAALFLGGAVLVVAGALSFAASVIRTLVHPASRAEATGWFFVFGAIGLAAASIANVVLSVRALDDGARLLPAAENNALVSLLMYGVILMFVGGVAIRAVASLTGRERSQMVARIAAILLAAGAALYACATFAGALGDPSPMLYRLADAAFIVIGGGTLLIVWATGIFHPRANRVAAASQVQFWFVRAACAWLAAASALLCWYAANGLSDGRPINQFELDAVRHMTTVGGVVMMIMGMALLVVPEFAGRRLQHPHEHPLLWSMFAAVNAAAVLRAWPSLEGIGWLSSTRYWPMAAAGALALAAVSAFAFMFFQSRTEQRHPGWALPAALHGSDRP